MIKLLHFLFCFFLFYSFSYAQNITGKVIDDNKNAIDLALIELINQADTNDVKVEYSDEVGIFIFENIAQGDYKLEVSQFGFENVVVNVTVNNNSDNITIDQVILTAIAQLLEEVKITSKLNYIERKADRTVINVDALISNAGGTALEALERAPGIIVDQNGNIRLKGNAGVAIYIDDKPTYLSGADLENYLKSLPTSSIKQIEIFTNPPAKYEAAGSGGIINIVTKRNRTYGVFGNVALSVQQGRYTRSNNNFNLTINKGKISFYNTVNIGVRESFQDLNINRFYEDESNNRTSSFGQNSFIEKGSKSLNIKLGVDYFLTENTTIGFSSRNIYSNATDNTDNLALIKNNINVLTNKVTADNFTDNDFKNITYNIYLKRLTDSIGSALVVDADYVVYNSESNQLFKNNVFDKENNNIYKDLINGKLPSEISIFAFKSDYSKVFNANSKFEAGIKSAYTKTDNEAAYQNTIDGVTTPDYNLSNRFQYDEWINAAYLNYAMSKEKIDYQIGLRSEITTLKGYQFGNPLKSDSSFNRSYFNVFPTFYISYRVDTLGKHVINFNYGRRIDRPFFQDLNPFISPLDRFTFYGGNPSLLPTFSNNFSLSHSYNSKWNTSLNYSKIIDGINETLEIRDGIYYSRPGNISTNHFFSLSEEVVLKFKSRYSCNIYAEVGYQIFKSKLYTENLNTNGFYQSFAVTNSLDIGKGWNAEVRADYQSDIISAQLLIKSYGTLNLATQKKLLKDKAVLKINLSDILYTRRADGIIYNLRNTDADWNSKIDTRSITLSFSYRFGKAIQNKLKHNGSGSESEQMRVKK